MLNNKTFALHQDLISFLERYDAMRFTVSKLASLISVNGILTLYFSSNETARSTATIESRVFELSKDSSSETFLNARSLTCSFMNSFLSGIMGNKKPVFWGRAYNVILIKAIFSLLNIPLFERHLLRHLYGDYRRRSTYLTIYSDFHLYVIVQRTHHPVRAHQ